MSIECDNTTPLGSKAASEILNENSSALLDAIRDLSSIANIDLNNDNFADPTSTLSREDLNETTNLLNNLLLQTPLDEFPVLKDRIDTGGKLSITDLAEFVIGNNTDLPSIKDGLSNYNTNLPDLSRDITASQGDNSASTTSGLNTGSGEATILGGGQSRLSTTQRVTTTTTPATGSGLNVFDSLGTPAVYGSTYRGSLATAIPILIYNLLNDLDFHFAINLGQNLTAKACGAYNDVLADLTKAFAVVKTGKALLSEVVDVAQFLSDPKALLEAIKQRASLEAIVATLEKVIQGVIEAAKKVVMAAAGSVLLILKGLESAAGPVIKKMKKMINDVNTFMEDPSVDKLKKGIEGIVADLASQFEKLTPENVANMMFRLCQMAQDLQGQLMAPAMELNRFANTVGGQAQALLSRQAQETKSAVSYGAIRISKEDRDSKKSEVTKKLNSGVTPDKEEEDFVTSQYPNSEEMNALINVSDSGVGDNIKFDSAVVDYEDGDGWKRVHQNVWLKLLRTHEQTKKTYTIKRGYQKPVDSVLFPKKKTPTWYSMGASVDIDVPSSERRETIIAASRAGFGGIRVYPSYIQLVNGKRQHYIDSGISETDRGELSLILDKHDIDGFRIKRS
jgi:hypothetical protein